VTQFTNRKTISRIPPNSPAKLVAQDPWIVEIGLVGFERHGKSVPQMPISADNGDNKGLGLLSFSGARYFLWDSQDARGRCRANAIMEVEELENITIMQKKNRILTPSVKIFLKMV